MPPPGLWLFWAFSPSYSCPASVLCVWILPFPGRTQGRWAALLIMGLVGLCLGKGDGHRIPCEQTVWPSGSNGFSPHWWWCWAELVPGWPGRACGTQGFLRLTTLATRPPCPHSEGAVRDWLDLFPIGDKSQHCPRMLLSFII